MGSILGGGGGGSSNAINDASSNVASTAQAGGQRSSQAITDASNNAANQINWGSEVAGTAAQQGSQASADAQRQALAYLQQQDALPSDLRNQALTSLGGLYNGPGTITDRAMASPLYKAAVQQGENSVLRNASATGGLRSGSASENLAQVNQNALIAAYNDQINGLQGLSALPSNANTIAGYQAGIGNTLGQGQANWGQIIGQGQINAGNTRAQGQVSAADAITNANNAAAQAMAQGQIASAQSQAQGSQNQTNNLLSGIGLGMQAYGSGMFSDRRLKSDIVYIGDENGVRKYSWTWNAQANDLGLYGQSHGVIADEADEIDPEAVSVKNGYLFVDYHKLGVSHGSF